MRSGSGFVSHAIALWYLKVILIFVCLNRLVILHMYGVEKVNKVAHFMLFVFAGGVVHIIFCCICRVNLCTRVTGKLLGSAMWRMVYHSFSCCLLFLKGRLSIFLRNVYLL